MSNKKVIIIGAGFAGLVAARELQTAGIDYEILEAKDRIGGRAWTEERMGRPLELGATWVHWFQAHIWTEIMRYGQRKEIHPSPAGNEAHWITEGKVVRGSEADIDGKLSAAMLATYEGNDEYFPNPYDPLWVMSDDFDGPDEVRERFIAEDQKNAIDLVMEAGLDQEAIDLVDAFWSAGYIGDPYTGSALMAKQWGALADNRYQVMEDITLKWKLKNGMQSLYNGIAGDLTGPIRLETPVVKVEHHDDGATVTTEDGENIEAAAVICTVPVGALGNIEFSPALPEKIQRVIDDKWNSQGAKIWIKIKGHHRFLGYAPKPAKMSIVRSEYFMDDGTTILVGFGYDNTNIDLNSIDDAQDVVNQWRDDLEVVDATGHNWVADKWAGQAWGTLRKGQFTEGWSLFDEVESSLYFAGSDYAYGWRGVCVDGAVEKGMTTARRVINDL
ncbi:flavin monoamine oxidase family protein [Corynebacterium testudinoris]|uniref:Monoamine oxidase n=1 Tax=Corynebacterium testudinoris TaxID=136857 RepID=A0A0G3H2Q7_9CORY|nr:NAD(P)/FAD-dependent oxidoreductase [Corynebacterium testudinoris]AKK07661.1 monoamine oxidase [Corynebacterium testudinoris]